MNPEEIPDVAEGVIWRLIDNGAVLVSPESGDIRVLNEVGTSIWQMIDGERNVGQIEARLQEQYDVPASRLQADLDAFFSELSERKLLVWKRESSPA